MPALHTGGTVVLLEERSFAGDELLAVVERERVTRLAIVGDAFARPILRALEAAEARGTVPDVSSLRTMNSSGAMWSAEVKDGLARFTDAILVDGLGSSEGGGYAQVTAGRSAASGTTARFTPAPDTLLLGLDDRPLPADATEPGLLASRTGAFGYYKDPDKTARTFKVIDGAQYVITGDWATRNEDGTITLHGRGSNCINSGGEKIFPEEVEEALKTHPAVDDCLVVGVPDERFGSASSPSSAARGRPRPRTSCAPTSATNWPTTRRRDSASCSTTSSAPPTARPTTAGLGDRRHGGGGGDELVAAARASSVRTHHEPGVLPGNSQVGLVASPTMPRSGSVLVLLVVSSLAASACSSDTVETFAAGCRRPRRRPRRRPPLRVATAARS